LRTRYQNFLLQWLRDGNDKAIEKIGVVFLKFLEMSAFGTAARLWWVAGAYVDFILHNDTDKQTVHGRILRQINDRFKDIETQGESALVRDAGDELVKIMLFYIGVGEKRTKRMDHIVDSFGLHDYFPRLKLTNETIDFDGLQKRIEKWHSEEDFPLKTVRQLISSYFETDQADNSQLDELIGKFGERNDDSSFHLASAFMFVEGTVSEPERVDGNWQKNGELKYRALNALNQQKELTEDLDGSQLSGQERQALLDVVGAEVESNLKEIEANLELFSVDSTNLELISGIDGQIRQIRGALQVLGEQQVGLLLKMAEDQFIAIESGETAATPAMIEALAISIGTMEEYVRGLQAGRTGMDYLLNRSITDLEVAIGKRVSRDDVEDLLDSSSDSLFSWLGNQSDLALFTDLKSSLRDLNTLAKKTKLTDVELLVKEQDRLVDAISQEPAFLTDNVTTTLQNNMVSITEQIVTLYGTEETQEEIESDAELAYKKSAIESDDGPRFHDDMELDQLGDEIAEAVVAEPEADAPSSTEIGKKNAVDQKEAPIVDEFIFDVFVEESEEVLEAANEQYAACLKDQNDRDSIRDLRRSFHTLKGSARMVGLNGAGEIAWFAESLFNFVLDTEKPLTNSILAFSRETIDEFEKQVAERYQNQHLIDTAEWGAKTERVTKEGDEESIQSAEEVEEQDVASEVEIESDELSLSEASLDEEMLVLDDDEIDNELELVEVESIDEGSSILDEPLDDLELSFDIDDEEADQVLELDAESKQELSLTDDLDISESVEEEPMIEMSSEMLFDIDAD